MFAIPLLLSLLAVAPPPKTRVDNVEEVLHGVKIADPYRWLEDQNSPETRAWIDAQNKYTRSFLDAVPGRAEVEKRLGELMRVEFIGTPVFRGGRYFFGKRLADQDLNVIYVRQGLTGKDEVLIDPHPMSADHTTSVMMRGLSDDGKLLIYGVRKGGEDEVELRFFDVDARQDIADRLPRARYGSASLTPDNKTLYYTRLTDEGDRLFRHAMGSNAAGAKVFGDGFRRDQGLSGDVTDDGRYLIIHVYTGSAATKVEVWAQDLAAGGPIQPIIKNIDARFFAGYGDGKLYVHTNWKAPNGRVLAIDLKDPAQERWREVIPESPKAAIEGVSLAGGKICVNYLENVQSRLVLFTPDGKRFRDIPVLPLGSVSGVAGRWDQDEAFFSFSSYHIPPTIYRYGIEKGRRDFWSRVKVPVRSEDFALKQVWYKSKDGTRVPMFILHRKGLKLDGSAPAYLTGYGGFTASLTPGFSQRAVLWAERGGVFALANLRGGGEFGEQWHRAGMFEKKQNVFDDFIAAAEYLIEKGYTRASKLAIAGGSNGGLLVGAAITQRPDLFRAALCSYPLLDMIRYHKFSIARYWVSEYGSAEDPEQFKYILAYSPYHRVKPGVKYPSVMFVTGDNDTRVAPLHARKMTALLQAANASDHPILLLYDTASGHSGGRPLKKQIEQSADELMYLYGQLQ